MGCPVKRADFKVTWLVDSLRYQQRQRNSSQRPLVQAYCASRLAESTIETGRCQVESRTFTHSRSVCDRTDERLDTPRQSLVPALPRRQPITVESIVSSRHLSHYKKKLAQQGESVSGTLFSKSAIRRCSCHFLRWTVCRCDEKKTARDATTIDLCVLFFSLCLFPRALPFLFFFSATALMLIRSIRGNRPSPPHPLAFPCVPHGSAPVRRITIAPGLTSQSLYSLLSTPAPFLQAR